MNLSIPSISQTNICTFVQEFVEENDISIPRILRIMENVSEDVKHWWMKAIEIYRSIKIAERIARKEAKQIASGEIPVYNDRYENLNWEISLWNLEAKTRSQSMFKSWKEYARPKHRSRCYKTTKGINRSHRLAMLKLYNNG